MTPRWDVLGLGSISVDDLLYVENYPMPDMKMSVLDRQRHSGGVAATALVAAVRMGASGAYCGILGADELSKFTIRELEREGVDCTAIAYQKEARPFHSTVIVVPSTGQRTILFSGEGVLGLLLEQITDELISACRVLFIDDSVAEVGLRAAEIAHRHGIPVVADCEHAERPGMLDLMEKVDHLIIGCNLAQSVTGADVPEDMVRALVASQRTCSVVTAGERGCWYAEHDGRVQHFPAFQVEAVDTTGCGDVFHGAYAASIAWGESIDLAIQIASAAAAIKATKAGGRSGIPDRATVDRFLAENLPD